MLRSLRMKMVCALSLLAGVVSLLFSQAGPVAGKRYALVVGINKYDNPDLPKLKAAENDAIALEKELRAVGYEVVRLTGKDATKKAIEEQLKTVGDKAARGGNDLFLVALSGHGMQFVENDEAYFCPVDARPVKERKDTLVGMNTVFAALKASHAGAKVLLVDACRNDPNVRGRSGVEKNSARAPDGVATLYSCTAGQKSCEDDKLGHGLFMYAVLEELRAAREAGKELKFAYLQGEVPDKVKERAASLPGQPAQSPEVVAIYSREPILVPRTVVVREAKPLKAPFGAKEIAAARAAWAKKLRLPAQKELDLGGGVKMEFVLIPPGEFDMGSPADDKEADKDEKPQRREKIAKAFYLQTTHTTQAQYVKLTGKPNPSAHRKGGDREKYVEGLDTANFPVEQVNHAEALEACQAAGKKVGWVGDLPREAEWEYACRAGTTTRYYFGDDAKDLGKYAWFTENSGDKRTDEVGKRLPNAFGLFDMHGNVFDWCLDKYGNSGRVLRGGSFCDDASICRAAYRDGFDPAFRFYAYGFRVCLRPD